MSLHVDSACKSVAVQSGLQLRQHPKVAQDQVWQFGEWSNFITNFLARTLRQSVCHGQGHYFDIRSEHQAEVQGFFDKQLPITLPVFSCIEDVSLFDHLNLSNTHDFNTQSFNVCKLCITSAAIFTSATKDTITEMCMAA
jgi:hypothetical protein